MRSVDLEALACVVVSVQRDLSPVEDAHVFQANCTKDGNEIATGLGRRRVVRVHVDGILRIPNAYIAVLDVLNETTTRGVGLDTETVVGAVDREIEDADRARAAVRLAADRHPMTLIKMI